MKHLINQIKCLIRGHKWGFIGKRYEECMAFDKYYPNGIKYWQKILTLKCTRCGKVKEEEI